MKKKVLSVVMAAAMMTSVFSVTAVTASAAVQKNLLSGFMRQTHRKDSFIKH